MYTVLIADDNRHWLESLETGINFDPDMRVIAKAFDGGQAIEMIEKLMPDAVVLDIIMPVYDGVYIANHISKEMPGYHPVIYILSGIGTDTVIQILNELDVDFYSMKPAPIEVIRQNLKSMLERPSKKSLSVQSANLHRHESELRAVVATVARQLGLPPHLKSTKFTVDALVYYLENPDCLRMLSKVLYPEIARRNGSSASAVEKHVRDALSQMQRNKTELFCEIFSYNESARITNSEFLSVAAGYITKKLNSTG